MNPSIPVFRMHGGSLALMKTWSALDSPVESLAEAAPFHR
jgi:hypothetical protein